MILAYVFIIFGFLQSIFTSSKIFITSSFFYFIKRSSLVNKAYRLFCIFKVLYISALSPHMALCAHFPSTNPKYSSPFSIFILCQALLMITLNISFSTRHKRLYYSEVSALCGHRFLWQSCEADFYSSLGTCPVPFNHSFYLFFSPPNSPQLPILPWIFYQGSCRFPSFQIFNSMWDTV